MARTFTPIRRDLIGSPERQAAGEIAAFGMNVLLELGAEEIDAENRREISNASIAMQKEWDGFNRWMIENPASAAEWPMEFNKRADAMRKGVLSGVKQPGAQQVVSVELQRQLTRWAGDVQNLTSLQIAKNANSDFELGTKAFLTESRGYHDSSDVQARLEAAYEHIEDGQSRGMTMAATPAIAEALKKQAAQKIIGDYVLQQALAAALEDDGANLIETVNEFAQEQGIEFEDKLFGPEEIDTLRKQYRLSLAQRQADLKKQADIAAETWRAEAMIKLRNQQLTYEDVDNSPIPTTGDLGRQEFYKLLDAQAKGTESDKLDQFLRTRDYPALIDIMSRIRSGERVSSSEIDRGTGKYWSFSHAHELHQMNRSDQTDPLKTVTAGFYMGKIKDLAEAGELLKSEKWQEQAQVYGTVINSLMGQLRTDQSPKAMKDWYDTNVEPLVQDATKAWYSRLWQNWFMPKIEEETETAEAPGKKTRPSAGVSRPVGGWYLPREWYLSRPQTAKTKTITWTDFISYLPQMDAQTRNDLDHLFRLGDQDKLRMALERIRTSYGPSD